MPPTVRVLSPSSPTVVSCTSGEPNPTAVKSPVTFTVPVDPKSAPLLSVRLPPTESLLVSSKSIYGRLFDSLLEPEAVRSPETLTVPRPERSPPFMVMLLALTVLGVSTYKEPLNPCLIRSKVAVPLSVVSSTPLALSLLAKLSMVRLLRFTVPLLTCSEEARLRSFVRFTVPPSEKSASSLSPFSCVPETSGSPTINSPW